MILMMMWIVRLLLDERDRNDYDDNQYATHSVKTVAPIRRRMGIYWKRVSGDRIQKLKLKKNKITALKLEC